jgi:hypothetical protein
MPFLFKLTKRLAHSRALALVALGIAACTANDHMETDPSTDAGTESGIELSLHAKTLSGRVASIAVSPSTATLTLGQSAQFTATAHNAFGASLSAASAVWSSSNTSIVTVSAAGIGTAVGAGQATLVATIGSVRGVAQITVTGSKVVTNPGAVADLAIVSIADTTATVSFTQVTDGSGSPASYEIRFAAAPISWGTASTAARGSCASPIKGTAIGAKLSCTINGLTPSTAYNFQIVPFRGTLNINAVFGALSNAPAASTTLGVRLAVQPVNVFFQESFNDANLSSRGWYDNTNVSVTTSDHTGAATASAQFHFLPGATTPTNGGAIRHKFPASNSMYVAYDVKYSANWVGSEHAYHPHEFYALSSWEGDYDGLSNNWLTLYLEENYQNGGIPRMSVQDNKSINTLLGLLPINLGALTEARSTSGCNGMVEKNMASECYNAPPWYNLKNLDGPVVFQPNPGPGYKNNWNHVEAYYQLNTIVNGVGQANGVMQYWFNGTLIIDRHDILFITGARVGLQLSQFVIAPYIGDGSPVDQSMWVDNLTVAAARGATP